MEWLAAVDRKNDFNWFAKNNKCSNINWLPFIYPKRADYNGLQDQTPDRTQFNWMVHFINNTERHGCMSARVRKKRENEVTRAPNCSQSQSRMNEPVFYRYVIQQIKQNRAIFVWMKKNKDFIKVRRKLSYNKHLIRRLTSQYGWVFLLVELYFIKYCRLVKIPSHIG